ncbi:MAG TPA: RAMP superfamily CRISPR-associated protein, partial [Nitrococcus sp.]|nr:RAMP superfamily CRISPR-associated protein [Nitrococcus sp.]
MLMNTKTLTVRFLTPAFLGDTEQRGAWRTPPFKAQLRQWWRLALAAQKQWDWRQIRAAEVELFGNAWPDQVARRSQMRLRLSKWQPGEKNAWSNGSGQQDSMTILVGRQKVDAALGFEPRVHNKQSNRPHLKYERAIEAGETAELRLAWPAEATGAEYIEAALALMSRFGTVGGRSRNGWGSYVLGGAAAATWTDYLIDCHEALKVDWVRGIGRDERGPLIWRTRKAYPSWE